MVKESDLVKHLHSRLDVWQLKKVVIHYDDLQNAGRKFINGRWIMQTKAGRPDLVVYITHKGQCWVYFIEAKRPIGGTWSYDQQVFAYKFTGLRNVLYEVVREPNQVDLTIEKITKHDQSILDSITME